MTVIKNIAKDRILQITVVITIISLFFARPRIEDINFHTLYSILAMLTIIQIFFLLTRFGCLSLQTNCKR